MWPRGAPYVVHNLPPQTIMFGFWTPSPWSLWKWTNCFSPPNFCHVDLASICHFLVLDPHLKAMGPYLWLSTNRIALFHWTLDLRCSSKGHGPNLGFSTNRIVGPSSKVWGSNLWLSTNRIIRPSSKVRRSNLWLSYNRIVGPSS
jgi:hypothetical protein